MTDWRTRARATPLLAALVLSVLAHAITLSGDWRRLPQTAADPLPLRAQLEPGPLTPPAHRAPVKQAPRALPARVAPVAAAPAILVADAPAPWSLPATAVEPAVEAQAPLAVAPPALPATPAPEPVVLAMAAPTPYTPTPASIKTLPRRGRITYSLNYYLSNMPTTVGRTEQTWEAVNNTYQLDSLSQTTGLARLTRFGPRTYHSSGAVTERGLLPHTFTSNVVVGGKSDDATAQFDWNTSTLQFGRPTAQKNTALPAGAQDLLSFMYQLSLAPPPRGRLQIPVTTGVYFENYELEVFDEETIETPLGKVRALPVKQVRRAGSETIEVWLGTDYHFLPLRIRFIGRDGTPGGEQVATQISFGEK